MFNLYLFRAILFSSGCSVILLKLQILFIFEAHLFGK